MIHHRSTRLIIILSYLIFISGTFPACICNVGKGLYCGVELNGDGCDDKFASFIWQCSGPGAKAEILGPCKDGCCTSSGQSSFCCNDNSCCSGPDLHLPIPAAAPINVTIQTVTSSVKVGGSPTAQASSKKVIDDSQATIIGSVIGGVTTIIAAMIAAIIGVKCKKRYRR